MALTDRQKAAQEGLEAAIRENRAAFMEAEGDDSVEILTDWILVACMVGYDDDGHKTNCYHFGLAGDSGVTDHASKGLLVHGLDLIRTFTSGD